MSRERKYDIPIVPPPDFLKLTFAPGLNYDHDEDSRSKTYESLYEYLMAPSQNNRGHQMRHSSVFEAETPGTMSLEDVDKQIDLGQWELKLGDMIVTLEVSIPIVLRRLVKIQHHLSNSQDLVGWYESDASDASTIKGIAAELAACIGPDLVKRTMLEFH